MVNRSSVVCVAGVLANRSSSVSSAMWSTVFSLAVDSSERVEEFIAKHHIKMYFFGYIFLFNHITPVSFSELSFCFYQIL